MSVFKNNNIFEGNLNFITHIFNISGDIKKGLQRKDYHRVNAGIGAILSDSILRWFEINFSCVYGNFVKDLFDEKSNNSWDKYREYYAYIVHFVTGFIRALFVIAPQNCTLICAIIMIGFMRHKSMIK
ncbi:hypothetical protein DCO58_09840 [Helicobacter saguini]|uniref:Uncharacterized protein n=1 Tax=Helicobacter saguini TaxID=1548018 RepID=A0A347VPF1_9HELI|nr:hypothetical protein [Helicobacter saguini]MWV61390.1 hypothetical protein [Helicobacter saguini]MWV67942.1 hypothetical protein [Helicobacter saguini]MWV70591.1 hypothetical protein [Helicobacter saguini]MWV72495.1 hypothetical protein [Helicobacter saguini]TLD94759.1 hypothetical protein LS64_004415 [Helicobacter saguini]